MPDARKPAVLVIEVQPAIRTFLDAALISNGFAPSFAETGREGLKMLKADVPEILILDLGLPDMDGLDIIRTLRGWSALPVIVLSARGQEQDKIAALELGADDYLTKPFGTGELVARLRAALRRAQRTVSASSSVFEAHGLVFNSEERTVSVDGKNIHLTPTEFRLLSVLVRQAGKIVTHRQILQDVWGKNSSENNHYLRIYTQHLREKLGDDPLNPKFIITEPGIGYKLRT